MGLRKKFVYCYVLTLLLVPVAAFADTINFTDPGDKTVYEGELLSFTLTARSNQDVSFSYSPSITGATIGRVNRQGDMHTADFTWTPTIGQAGVYDVTWEACTSPPGQKCQRYDRTITVLSAVTTTTSTTEPSTTTTIAESTTTTTEESSTTTTEESTTTTSEEPSTTTTIEESTTTTVVPVTTTSVSGTTTIVIITTTVPVTTSIVPITTSVPVTTTSVPVSTTTTVQPECATDADCDDGDFCTGIESCEHGVCVSSGDPCDPEQQVCSSQFQSCLAVVKILNVPTALLSAKGERKLRAPILVPKLHYWVRVTIDAENHVDINESQFSIVGETAGCSGVEIDHSRKIRQALLKNNRGRVFWVPVTVSKNATAGLWKITIETIVADVSEPFIEIVEGAFIIR